MNADDIGSGSAAAAADGDAIDDDGRVRRAATRGGVSDNAAESIEGGALQPPNFCNL